MDQWPCSMASRIMNLVEVFPTIVSDPSCLTSNDLGVGGLPVAALSTDLIAIVMCVLKKSRKLGGGQVCQIDSDGVLIGYNLNSLLEFLFKKSWSINEIVRFCLD